MDFKEYRQKAREYEKNKCIIDNNIEILKEDGIIVEEWGENSGTLKVIESMSTADMQEIEKEFNVKFSLGGYKSTKFDFNDNIDGDYNPLMKEIRVAQKRTYELYTVYFKEVLQSVYHNVKICGVNHDIELGRKFWGFMVRPKIDKVLTTDELIAIEQETDSTFFDYNVTTGYQFNFNREK